MASVKCYLIELKYYTVDCSYVLILNISQANEDNESKKK